MRSFHKGNSSLNGVVIAPLWRRIVAWGIDVSIVVACQIITMMIALFVYATIEYFRTGTFITEFGRIEAVSDWLVYMCMVIPFIIYHTLFLWLWKGHTPGKNLLQVRVLDKHGENPSFTRALIRALLMPLSVLSLLLGYLLFFMSRKNSSLHDWIAGTIVLREEVEHEILYDPTAMTSL